MKVRELIKGLLAMPQDMEVFIRDADDGGLLRLREGDVSLIGEDPNYKFNRVEVGAPYFDGVEDRRIPRTYELERRAAAEGEGEKK